MTDTHDNRPAVAIYRRTLLTLSETFIADHINGLKCWRAVPIARSAAEGSTLLHSAQVHAINGHGLLGKLGNRAFAHAGWSRPLTRYLAHRKTKIVHAHFLTDAVEIMRFTRRMGLPLVVTAHGFDATTHDHIFRADREGRRFLARRDELKRSADLILCVSDFIRDRLIAQGWAPEKLIVHRLGIDRSLFVPGRPAGERSGALFAGRLVEKKGAHLLIEAWLGLDPKVRAQGLTIIGEGPERTRLMDLAAAAPDVTFLGAQGRDAVRTAMTHHRLFAFPSIQAESGDAEGMGVVGMEAQAVGTPVVAFDEGTSRELLAPDRSGLIVKNRSVAGLTAALTDLLTNDDHASALGHEGPAVVAERFDLSHSHRRLENIYDRLVEKGTRNTLEFAAR